MTQSMNKTIAQQLGIKDFPFITRGRKGRVIYYEYSDSSWMRYEYDSDGKYTYHIDSDGYWWRKEYDSDGNQIYYENSYGRIIDNRPKEIIEVSGIKYQRIDE